MFWLLKSVYNQQTLRMTFACISITQWSNRNIRMLNGQAWCSLRRPVSSKAIVKDASIRLKRLLLFQRSTRDNLRRRITTRWPKESPILSYWSRACAVRTSLQATLQLPLKRSPVLLSIDTKISRRCRNFSVLALPSVIFDARTQWLRVATWCQTWF